MKKDGEREGLGGKIGREAISLSFSGLISPLFSPPEWNDLTGGPRVLEKRTRKAKHTPRSTINK